MQGDTAAQASQGIPPAPDPLTPGQTHDQGHDLTALDKAAAELMIHWREIIMLFDSHHLPSNFFTSFRWDATAFVWSVAPYLAARWFFNVKPAEWNDDRTPANGKDWVTLEQDILIRLWREVGRAPAELIDWALAPFRPPDANAGPSEDQERIDSSEQHRLFHANWKKVARIPLSVELNLVAG